MKLTSIKKDNRELIIKFFKEKGFDILSIENNFDFKLLDKSPTNDYYSYFITEKREGRPDSTAGIIIDYEKRTVILHRNYKTLVGIKF